MFLLPILWLSTSGKQTPDTMNPPATTGLLSSPGLQRILLSPALTVVQLVYLLLILYFVIYLRSSFQ